MANPFLTSAPMDPRGGFGFQRPPVPGMPYTPFDPVGTVPGIVGIDTPVGRLEACPPGTHCGGTGGRILGQTFCIGGCVPDAPGLPIDPGQPQPRDPRDPAMPLGRVVGAKRKRMNYSNQKALRRALRRATGYARQQKSIRKAAGEFAREFGPKSRRARRDLPAHHEHVR